MFRVKIYDKWFNMLFRDYNDLCTKNRKLEAKVKALEEKHNTRLNGNRDKLNKYYDEVQDKLDKFASDVDTFYSRFRTQREDINTLKSWTGNIDDLLKREGDQDDLLRNHSSRLNDNRDNLNKYCDEFREDIDKLQTYTSSIALKQGVISDKLEDLSPKLTKELKILREKVEIAIKTSNMIDDTHLDAITRNREAVQKLAKEGSQDICNNKILQAKILEDYDSFCLKIDTWLEALRASTEELKGAIQEDKKEGVKWIQNT